MVSAIAQKVCTERDRLNQVDNFCTRLQSAIVVTRSVSTPKKIRTPDTTFSITYLRIFIGIESGSKIKARNMWSKAGYMYRECCQMDDEAEKRVCGVKQALKTGSRSR